MVRKIKWAAVAVVCALLCACGAQRECVHEWRDASCTVPRMCSVCGATEGVIPGHDWQESEDGTMRSCARCGAAEEIEDNGGNSFNTYDNKEQQETTARYVLNSNSGVFHDPSCRDVPKISPDNYSTSDRTREELVAYGWHPCAHCAP